jgi:predicted secreted protein
MAISGKTGTVTVGGSAKCVTEWSVNNSIDRIDVTSTCSAGLRELISGISEWTGSFTSLDYISGNAQTATVVLSNDDVTISGSALIDFAATSPVDGRAEYTYDLAFTGAVTATAPE